MTACDGIPFSVFITSPDIRVYPRAMGHKLPQSAVTIKQKVSQYANLLREKVMNDIQFAKEANQRFSLTFDEWPSVKISAETNV